MSPWKLRDGRTLLLLTPEEFKAIPDGVRLTAIDGEEVVKGRDRIDGDTRYGHLAYGFIDVAKVGKPLVIQMGGTA